MPGIAEKICAMPTASDTAPPARPATFSPTSLGELARFTGSMPRPANVLRLSS